MSDRFVKGDIVLVRQPPNVRSYPARVVIPSIKGAKDRCAVVPLFMLAKEGTRTRFVPKERLDHALWTFAGFVRKP